MDITITSQESIRILCKILTFSSKLSDTLQLTPQPPNLTIRVLNSTQSAYTNFKLHPAFFASCRFAASTPQKLSIKALLPIFRTSSNINIVHITTSPLTISVNTKTVIKTFIPPLQEGRVPAITTTTSPNRIITTAPFLQTLLINFHTRLDEITIIPSADSLKLVSFLDEASPANLMLRTEMTVSSNQLDEHQYCNDNPIALTLFYRPFRAAIDFCEAFEQPLSISYDQPGLPVSIFMDILNQPGDIIVHARFVFASRMAEEGVVKKRSRLNTHREDSHVTVRRERERDTHNFTPVVESSGVVEATQEMRVSYTPPPDLDPPVDDAHQYDEADYAEEDEDDDFVEGTPPPEE